MKRPTKFDEFKNIRVLPSGYQVTLVRGAKEFSKHFAGHSDRSLHTALRFRDRLLKELPDKRLNKVPRRILAALNLDRPVVGVFRPRGRKHYAVVYRNRDGRLSSRAFGWSGGRDEVEAYAAAIAFRKRTGR